MGFVLNACFLRFISFPACSSRLPAKNTAVVQPVIIRRITIVSIAFVLSAARSLYATGAALVFLFAALLYGCNCIISYFLYDKQDRMTKSGKFPEKIKTAVIEYAHNPQFTGSFLYIYNKFHIKILIF